MEFTYLKNKYIYPVISIDILRDNFPKRYERSNQPKIIITGIRHFECIIDLKNEFLSMKSFYIKENYMSSSMG